MNTTLRDRAEVDVTSALVRLGFSFNTTTPPTGPSRIWSMTFSGGPAVQAVPVILFVNNGCFGGAVPFEGSDVADIAAANRALFAVLPAVRLVQSKKNTRSCSLRCDFPLSDEGPAVALSAVAFACTTLQMGANVLVGLDGFTIAQDVAEEIGAFDVDLDGLVRASHVVPSVPLG